MTRLFIEAYLDEDVNVLLAALLRSRGFGATSAAKARQLGKSDRHQLQFAADRGMSLITQNRSHFEELGTIKSDRLAGASYKSHT